MRQTAARLNRALLGVLGLLALLAGAAGVLVGTGLLPAAGRAVGLTLDRPDPDRRLAGAATADALGRQEVVVLVGLAGLVLALLGVAWLLAQVPRRNQAKPFRLQDDAAAGLTRCAPKVLTEAVEAQVEALPGVTRAAAVLRGTAEHPDLTLRVTADDRTDLPALLQTLQTRVATDLGDALDTRLARLGVQLEVTATKARSDRIVLEGRPA